MDLRVDLRYEIDAHGADFIFHIHAANTACQTVLSESLRLSQPIAPRMALDPATGNRSLRLRALPGELLLHYTASVDIEHHRADPAQVGEVPVCRLPAEAIPYLYPSRYCQSDQLTAMACQLFGGHWQGHGRVQAIQAWVQQHMRFAPNTSNSATSALDTLQSRVGVCRDFAHLMIALCRALNIPARFVTGTDYGADPALGPPDFHAYVEVYLGDRWYLFDPSGTALPMGLMRLATGRDAADVAFATVFGGVRTHAPGIHSEARLDGLPHHVLPQRTRDALSTDAGRSLLG